MNTPVLPELARIPGWHKSRVLADSMHGVNLGTAQHLCGNILYELACDYGQTRADRQRVLEQACVALTVFSAKKQC
jgi:hypothetical protein